MLCSGKVYYDIVGHEAREPARAVAVARHRAALPVPGRGGARELIASYPALDEIVWAQEEPQNMGAWRTIRHRLEEAAAGVPSRYVGRPWRASTAEGYPTAHRLEQDRIARAALDARELASRAAGLVDARLRASARACVAWPSRICCAASAGVARHIPDAVSARPIGAQRRPKPLGMRRLLLRCAGTVDPEPAAGGRCAARAARLPAREGEWRSSRRKACRRDLSRSRR